FGAAGSLITAFALFGLVNGTLVSPFGGSAVAETTDSHRYAYRNDDFDRCLSGLHTRQSRTVEDVAARRLCRLGDPAAPVPTFALWGDSHAEAIRAGVEAS